METKSDKASHGFSVEEPRGERGASLVEYALLVALIAVACILAVTFFGTQTGDTFSRVSSSVEAT